jgi:Uma2 family endonuclease
MREIVLPEAKPALEWVNGRVLQKVTPQQPHALAQGVFFAALHAWAQQYRCGSAGTEWEFRLEPPGEGRRPLVPDVAYLSYARLSRDEQKKTGIPHMAPDAVVEVISPTDLRRDIDEKTRVYLASGTSVVFLVDTALETVTVTDIATSCTFGRADIVEHATLGGFAMVASTLFELP